MKKVAYVMSFVGIVMMFSGCSSKPDAIENTEEVDGVKNSINQEQMTQKEVESDVASEMPIEWSKELAKGASVQCSYVIDGTDGKLVNVSLYVDKDHYKTETKMNEGIEMTLFDGSVFYSWVDGKKIGMKMEKSCMENMKDSLPKVPESGGDQLPLPESYDSPEDIFAKAPNIVCSKLSDDVEFFVPTNVLFTDQCEIIKKSLEQLKDVQVSIPEDVQKMMPQMNQ